MPYVDVRDYAGSLRVRFLDTRFNALLQPGQVEAVKSPRPVSALCG